MNIQGFNDITDPHYRYKRESFIIQHAGKGIKKKTTILNLNKVCRSLNRSTDEVAKYISDFLRLDHFKIWDRHYFQGFVDIEALDNALAFYIEDYILCKNCNLPTTVYEKHRKKIMQACTACGYLSKIDSTEFIDLNFQTMSL